MLLALKTNTGIDYYENLPFRELQRKIKAFDSLTENGLI